MPKRFVRKMLVPILLILSLTGCSLGNRFDAQEYVQAILDQTFQGDVTEAMKVIKDANEEELKKQYEDGIAAFTANNIISGIEMDDETAAKFNGLCKNIFSAMRYKVKEAEKIEDGRYEVEVTIQPTDIFPNFVKAVQEDSQKLMEKAANGEYQGTEEEINAQMQEEFIQNAYTLLEEASKNAEYGKETTIKLGVEADKDGIHTIVTEDLSNMIIKILRLDEIQD